MPLLYFAGAVAFDMLVDYAIDKSGSETARKVKDGIDLAMMLTPFGAAKNGGKQLAKTAAKEGAEFVSENLAKTTAKTATIKSSENVVKNTAKTSSTTASKTNRKDGAISNLIEDGVKKREQKLLDSKFTGTNWNFDPNKDVDMLDKTFHEALDEAFRRTGVPKSEFKVVQWGKDKYGKSVPVEYSRPNGANVNLDIPKYNNPTNGPNIPHIGYKSGKKNDKTVGHIFVDGVPATRYKE